MKARRLALFVVPLLLLFAAAQSTTTKAANCGDGFCDPDEVGWCSDCNTGSIVPAGLCGDNFCDANEVGWCSDCSTGVQPSSCGDGFCDVGETSASCNADCGPCEVKYIDNYRCSGSQRQRQQQQADCMLQWATLETCNFGCVQTWASPALPVSCAPNPCSFGGCGGGGCTPVASCAVLGCGHVDSCGNSCGACSTPTPTPSPTPTPTPAPVTTPGAAAPKPVSRPLNALSISFPLQPLFLRSAYFPDADCVKPGESATLALNVQNKARSQLNDVSFTATIPELDVRARIGPVKLTGRGKVTKFLDIAVPAAASEGAYYLKITVTNNKFVRTVFREFDVRASC